MLIPVLLLFTIVILYGVKDQQEIKKAQKGMDNITINDNSKQKNL